MNLNGETTNPEAIYKRASFLFETISNSRTVGDFAEATEEKNRLSLLRTKTARFYYWDYNDDDEVEIMRTRIISDALRSTARARNEELSRGDLTVGRAEVNNFITHRLMIYEVENMRNELAGIDEQEIRSRYSTFPLSKDMGRAVLEAIFTLAFRGNNSFVSKVELSLASDEEGELYHFIDTGISSLELRLDNADGKEVEERLIEGYGGELLTERFVEELNLRFEKRSFINASRWAKEPDRVISRVRRARCFDHNIDLSEEGCSDLINKLKDKNGNVSMSGPPAPTRGGCCVKCLYPDMEKPVSNPLVYINAFNEDRGNPKSKPVDIDGVQRDDVDYCDAWAYGLLADLFSDDWETMEKAIYSNSHPRFYDLGTLRVVKEFFSIPDMNPWATRMSPWVIFEVTTAYGLDVNAHLQDLSDSICKGMPRGSEHNKEDLARADRVFGGLASCFSRECLKTLRRVHVAVMKNNLFGCLMVTDEDAGYVPTLGDYIRFRWNLFLKDKRMGNIGAFGKELAESGYEVRVEDSKLAFRKGPRIVEGRIVEKSPAVWHFYREQPSNYDETSVGDDSDSERFQIASHGLDRATSGRVIMEHVLVEGLD